MTETVSGKRRLLVLYHTGTGTVLRTLYLLLSDLLGDPKVEVTFQKVQSAPAFPQPWSLKDFFRVPALAMYGVSVTIEPLDMAVDEKYDAIVFAGPIWNMNVAVPLWSIFDSPWVKLFKDTPVITLVTCRSNYGGATERIAERVTEAGGTPMGRIIITDPRPFEVTGKSLQQLLLKGKRRTYFKGEWVDGVIPDKFLSEVKKYTPAIKAALSGASAEEVDKLLEGSIPEQTPEVVAQQAVNRRTMDDLAAKLKDSHGIAYVLHVIKFVYMNLLEDMGYKVPGSNKSH